MGLPRGSSSTVSFKSLRISHVISPGLSYTVEFRLTTTPLRRPPRYYDHFKKSQMTYHMFPCKKVSQIRLPRYSELRPLFSAQMQFLTPELRPLTLCGRIFSRKSEFSSLVCFVWRQISYLNGSINFDLPLLVLSGAKVE